MARNTLKYREWELAVDKELTRQTYATVVSSGADTCVCNDCKNYVACRELVFPAEIRALFTSLGIDYRKEVEAFQYELLPNGLHHIAGWFHFKGQLLAGPNFRVPVPGRGFHGGPVAITENFALGFTEASDLAFFADKTGLVQVEFEANIPWVLDKALETGN